MANIKIKSRWDLGSYGTNIKNFSDAYTVETNSLYRNFTDKAGSDSKGEAVNAYFKKLNALQDQVFAQLPSAIKSYGNVVTTYAGAIEDAGFQDECFSSDSGASSLEELLKGEQVKQISDVSEALNQAFKQASEAMGTLAEDTSKICETATSDLTDAGAKRIKKDKEVQDAYSTFTSKLTTATTNISNFQNVLNNALYLAEIPSSTIFRAIANGNLTAEQMYYLDVPKTKEDAQALKAIISDKPGDVLKVDPNKISEQMYAVIASEQNDWTMTNNNKMWQHFVNALGEYSVERNDIFTNGVLKGEDALAQIKMSQMYQLYLNKPTLPENATPEQIEEYNELIKQYQLMYDNYQTELNAINSSIGLMYSLQVLEIGTSKVSKFIENKRTMEHYRYKKVASVELKNGQFEIKTDKGEHKSEVNSVQSYYKDKDLKLTDKDYNWNEHKEYTATTEFSDFGMQASKYSERLKKLQEERQEAHDKFSESILSAIAETGISFLPFGSTAVSVIKTLDAVSGELKANELLSNGTSTIKSGRDSYKSFYKKATGQELPDTKFDKYWGHWSKLSSGVSDGIKALNTYNLAIKQIDEKTSEAKDNMMETVLDYGGWDLTEDGKSTVANGRAGQYYDFNATLRAMELDENGLTGFVSTESDLDASIKKSISKDDRDKYADVIAYVKGEKTELTLKDMTADQLEKFDKIVANLGKDSMSKFGKYLDNRYQMEEVH